MQTLIIGIKAESALSTKLRSLGRKIVPVFTDPHNK
jgi:hypothetical protein